MDLHTTDNGQTLVGSMPLNYLRINSGDGGRNLGGVLCSIGSGGVGFQATRVTG
ncbi:MAG: hypothetical protein AB9M53_02380 [Leptothrix sp. (in: b-proteobacteria)]